MRILYFYQYFSTPRGAWGTRVYEFARRWVREGDRVTVVSAVYDKTDLVPRGLVSRHRVEGIEVVLLNVPLSNKHGVATRLLTFALYAGLACWFALRLPADVIVASSGPITVALPALVARWVRGVPFVFEARDLWPQGAIELGVLRGRIAVGLARRFERLCYRTAAAVVVASEGMRDWIVARYGFDGIEVVPNASDNDLFGTPGDGEELPAWTRGKDLVVYAGTLGTIDDCRQILEMAEVLQKRGEDGIDIILIGDGSERQDLEAWAVARGLVKVRFLGLLSREEVAVWVRSARCALCPVKDVPFLATCSPNKLFDAFAAGVPVVQSTRGWIRDLVEREGCGFSVEPDEPEAWADAVIRLVSDARLQNRMGASARRLARGPFDRDRLAAKMRNILERVSVDGETRKTFPAPRPAGAAADARDTNGEGPP